MEGRTPRPRWTAGRHQPNPATIRALRQDAAPLSPGDVAERLAQAPLLAGLPRATLADMATVAQIERHGRGMFLSTEGTEATVSVVLEGSVRLLLLSITGTELTLETWRTGAVIGPLWPQDAPREEIRLGVAEDGTVLAALPRHLLLHAVMMSPVHALRALAWSEQQSATLRHLLREVTFWPLEARVGHDPARRAARGTDTLMESQAQLAARVGANVQQVNKVLRRLRERGLIAFVPHRPGIRILDRAGLESL